MTKSSRVCISENGQVTVGRRVRKPTPSWVAPLVTLLVILGLLLATGAYFAAYGKRFDTCKSLEWTAYQACMSGKDYKPVVRPTGRIYRKEN